MSRYRWVILGVTCPMMVLASASADVIRSSGEVGPTAALAALPAIAPWGLEAPESSRLALSPALVEGPWSDLTRRPLLNLDLAGPSFVDLATSPGWDETLPRPELPSDPLLGTSSARLVASEPARKSHAGAEGETGRNIRIPEPASVALVAAGVFALLARSRLRRTVRPSLAENPA